MSKKNEKSAGLSCNITPFIASSIYKLAGTLGIHKKYYCTYVRKEGWLEAGEVGQHDPVPSREEDILALDVTVVELLAVALLQHFEQLEDDPPLLHGAQEGACAMGPRRVTGSQQADAMVHENYSISDDNHSIKTT